MKNQKPNWIKVESKVLDHYEYLNNKKGKFLGYVCKFRDSCFYAWSEHRKIGNYNSIGAAKRAIEKML